MTVLRTLATIERDTNLPEDRSTNTWHTEVVGDFAAASDLDDIHDAFGDFYETIAPLMLSQVNANLVTLKTYNLLSPMPRVAVRESTRVIAPNAGGAGPEEVAVCLSFQGIKSSGVPQARRRGRVFIGPLSSGMAEVVAGRVRVYAAGRTGLANAAAALLLRSTSQATWDWVVYSPTQDASVDLEAAATPVTNGWVDDAFDTVRSRGPAPSVRTLFGTP